MADEPSTPATSAAASPAAEASESAAPQATPAEHHGLPRTGGSGTSFALGTLVGLVAATAALLALGYRASKEN